MNFWRCCQEMKPDSLVPGLVFVSVITSGVCVCHLVLQLLESFPASGRGALLTFPVTPHLHCSPKLPRPCAHASAAAWGLHR